MRIIIYMMISIILPWGSLMATDVDNGGKIVARKAYKNNPVVSPRWEIEEWSQYSTCDFVKGEMERSRKVFCKNSKGAIINYKHCGDKPSTIEVSQCGGTWQVGVWGEYGSCSNYSQSRGRSVLCVDDKGAALNDSACISSGPKPSSSQSRICGKCVADMSRIEGPYRFPYNNGYTIVSVPNRSASPANVQLHIEECTQICNNYNAYACGYEIKDGNPGNACFVYTSPTYMRDTGGWSDAQGHGQICR